MRWRMSEIPVQAKSFRARFTLGSDHTGSAALEKSGISTVGTIEALHLTDPPR